MKPFNSFVEWAKANAHPVSSASEDNAEELSFLKSALADARVVSLGEFQHYTGVFNAFHFKLFRYLVENLGLLLSRLRPLLRTPRWHTVMWWGKISRKIKSFVTG